MMLTYTNDPPHTHTQLMSSVKTVLIEMLSSFDAKSRLSAKQLKDQLHTCWPVPNSRVVLDQLRKELRDEMKQSLEVVGFCSRKLPLWPITDVSTSLSAHK